MPQSAAASAAPGPAETSATIVQLAAYGSVTGALLALGGPRASATERAVLGVNGAAGVGLVSGIWSARALARRPAPVVSDAQIWHELESAEAARGLGSTPDGLTDTAAAERLASRRPDPEERPPGIH
ncbi:hypothetical protein ABN034_12595 [Actinopolymorpha sp. B11F2]|uniref:hypothetical protein n=1 Tax=Actinopolymorpha sp. B11F2 TaxID=3160862 RepID=UPI0032E4D92E